MTLENTFSGIYRTYLAFSICLQKIWPVFSEESELMSLLKIEIILRIVCNKIILNVMQNRRNLQKDFFCEESNQSWCEKNDKMALAVVRRHRHLQRNEVTIGKKLLIAMTAADELRGMLAIFRFLGKTDVFTFTCASTRPAPMHFLCCRS